MKRTVVIPAYNEESTIHYLVSRALGYADEVIVSDNESTDKTAEIARLCGAVVVTSKRDGRGLAGVYLDGVRAALRRNAYFVVEMDAGGSHDPGAIPDFWQELLDYEMVAGSRFLEGGTHTGSWKRRWLSRAGTWLVNRFGAGRFGVTFTDATSGFIGYRASALRMLLCGPIDSHGHFYQSEMRIRASKLKLSISELPINYHTTGSSLNWRSILEALQLLFR